jgi:small-conductance mechanosensitive channel
VEEYLLRLEEILAGWLGGAILAQTVSRLLLIMLTGFVFWFLWKVVGRIGQKLHAKIDEWTGTRIRGLRIQRQRILSQNDMAKIFQGVVTWLQRLFKFFLVLAFVNIVFFFFSWSRDVAYTLMTGLTQTLQNMLIAVVDYLPSLAVIVVVLLIARFVLHILKLVFSGIQKQKIKLPHFYPEWSRTSFNLLRIMVIALTLVIIFPYLPGSASPAFQGFSIFFGVLLSLGSTSAVANVVAGIVITFTRAFKVGDRVKISNTEGDIVERSAFVTKIMTPKNVEVSIPNAAVLNNHIINYSAQADKTGLTLHTTITIGYDISWVKVHELLIAAAGQTEHIEPDPAPFVLQTALDDFYVEYELNANTRFPNQKPKIYSDLHANILTNFQQAGVEIMSPHYLARRDGSAPAIPDGDNASVVPG